MIESYSIVCVCESAARERYAQVSPTQVQGYSSERRVNDPTRDDVAIVVINSHRHKI